MRASAHPFLVALALAVVACVAPPERELSRVEPRYASLPNGHDPLNPDRLSPIYDPATSGIEDTFVRHLERLQGRPLNLVSLSGGGQNGAFGAGFLLGWSESGRRPVFDIVGGVSTGALLATHALLGTPADDAVLQEMYLQVTADDIYDSNGLLALATGADSLMDTAPLREMIARFITAETLERVAEAWEKEHRLLVVGATNVDYAQTWLFNLSMIAQAGDLELYRKVLLASASFPIAFPPVEIDGHLFVDGAARSNLVVPGTGGTHRPDPPLYGAGQFYLIANGKLDHPPTPLRRQLGEMAAATLGVMMDTSMQAAVTRSYFGVQFLGYEFNMVAIPEDVEIGKDPLAFDPKQMRAAFDAGRTLGREAQPWAKTPPNPGDLPDWASDAIHALD